MNFRILIIFLVAFYSTVTFSQNYTSVFGEMSTKWYRMHCDSDCRLAILDFWKDSIVDGENYKYSEWYLLRESEDTSKLYIRHPLLQEDFMIMDLNLNIGDTFFISIPTYLIDTAIVDTLYYNNGRKTIELDYYWKEWWFPPSDSSDLKAKFIEGVGSNLFNLFPNEYLNCIEKDGEKLYTNYIVQEYQYLNRNSDSCNFSFGIGSVDNITDNKVIVYSNPTTTSVRIEFNNFEKQTYSIEIYNIQGMMIVRKTTSNNFIEINASSIKTGIFIYKIYNNSRYENQGKFILFDH